jgi:putative ATPase
LEDVRKTGNLPVPLKIRNAPTKLMKDLSYGKGYEAYPRGKNTSQAGNASPEESYLPDKLKGKKYLKNFRSKSVLGTHIWRISF